MNTRIAKAAALMILLAAPVAAQNTDIEALAGLNFQFSNPGARALGMGGAFLGLADDASAAEANPAGLTILRKPEVTIEGQNYRMAQDVNVSGVYPDLEQHEFSDFSRSAEVTFASIVYPRGNGAMAFYYHLPIRYTNSVTVFPEFDRFGNITTNVPSFYLPQGGTPVSAEECARIQAANPSNPFACLQYQILPFQSNVELDLETMGISYAWNFGTLSVGAGVRYQTFEENAVTLRAAPPDFSFSSQVVQAVGALDSSGELVLDEETDTTFTVGFKWTVNSKLSFGGVYKEGPEFPAPTFVTNAGSPTSTIETNFHVPDVTGIGVSYRPIPSLTLNVDAVMVEYSNLIDDFTSVLGVSGDEYESEDITELRGGFEYFLPTKIPVAIRAGYWKEPAHALKFVGPLDTPERVAAAILFPGREDQTHKSYGIGLAWPSFQIDAAYDTSDTFKVGSLSAVYRF